jgi:transketolase
MSQAPIHPDVIRDARMRLLRMHFEAGVGHVGGNLSAIDILLCLYHRVLGPMDAFLLSKGHAAGALYVTLWSVGSIGEEELKTFHKDDTRLSGHPPAKGLPQVLFATGSLGHGLGLASGLALAKKLRGEKGHVFCLTSDGEWNEGSCWESLIFAVHRKLANLTVIIDVNGLQGFGLTKEVADLEPLGEKFRAFGCEVVEVDGHSMPDLLAKLGPAERGPRVILAKTRKGCGVSFMEGRMEWHYLPLNAEQYALAVKEVGQCAAAAEGWA